MNAFTENSERAFSRQTAELFENYGRGFVRESNFYQKYFVLLLHLKPIIYGHSLAWLALFYITSSLILFFFFWYINVCVGNMKYVYHAWLSL